jgi:hypothetical protein
MSLEKQLSIEEGQALIHGGLGEYELKWIISLCTPLAWTVRSENGDVHTRNGTAFFLDAGEGLFAVTACHVIEGWRHSTALEDAGPLRLAGDGYSVPIDWDARVIDAHSDIDTATFRIDRDLGESARQKCPHGISKAVAARSTRGTMRYLLLRLSRRRYTTTSAARDSFRCTRRLWRSVQRERT